MIKQIRLLDSPEEVQRLYNLIRQYPLDYPNYFVWLEKCRRQLELGEKRAFYVMDNGSVIGSVIFQKHCEDESVLEIKNFRVSDEYKGKGVGSALEIMLCSFGRFNGFSSIQVDTHYDNFAVIRFLTKRGYVLKGEENLYVSNKPEIILVKDLLVSSLR